MSVIEIYKRTKSRAECTKCNWWNGGAGSANEAKIHADTTGHIVETETVRTTRYRGAGLRQFGVRNERREGSPSTAAR